MMNILMTALVFILAALEGAAGASATWATSQIMKSNRPWVAYALSTGLFNVDVVIYQVIVVVLLFLNKEDIVLPTMIYVVSLSVGAIIASLTARQSPMAIILIIGILGLTIALFLVLDVP